MRRIIGGAVLILLGVVAACGEEDDGTSGSASGGSTSSSSTASDFVEEFCRMAMLAEDECSGVNDYDTVDACTVDAQEEVDAYPDCTSEREALAACYADKGASDLECDEEVWSVPSCAELEDAEYDCLDA